MREYIQLRRMELVPAAQINRPGAYLPHHGVFHADNPNKIRVVFNGISLNDTLLPGPKLQADITVVVSNWRHFKVTGTTNVEKLYRQIVVHRDDVDCQRVLWRADLSKDVREYRCTTVTYGTAAAHVLSHQLYVDNIFFGVDSVKEAISARNQLISLLAMAETKLAKWAANNSSIIQDFVAFSPESVTMKMDKAVSTLGLKWTSAQDYFTFHLAPRTEPLAVTRRSILSELSSTFNPMGWLAPVLVSAKLRYKCTNKETTPAPGHGFAPKFVWGLLVPDTEDPCA
ncbi:unnamed protein product [Trichogramma brassicae]|uniref:Uncharacterized protein n=1 Tax=Trichogramma brassicae TaxID=86971 RepID=A0A6H5IMM6_9HYME|nr:unnamed protein product [Trichogramma brassicae]